MTFLSSSLHTAIIISSSPTVPHIEARNPYLWNGFSGHETRLHCMCQCLYDANDSKVYTYICMCMFTARFHVTTHKFKRREDDEGEGKKRRNNSFFFFFFFKAAHYPAVSGCMAPSQNIMMRINSPGTTSFCWRPSQGSASAPPSNSFPLFLLSPLLPSSLTHWCLCHVIRWWGARQQWLHIAHH